MTLMMFTADDEEWVIAESPADAVDIYCAHIGAPCAPAAPGSDPDKCNPGTHIEHWTPLPDDKALTLVAECPETHKADVPCPRGCDDNFLIRTKKTCAEWCEQGRGHWGSANW